MANNSTISTAILLSSHSLLLKLMLGRQDFALNRTNILGYYNALLIVPIVQGCDATSAK